jgi:hypothetical protein
VTNALFQEPTPQQEPQQAPQDLDQATAEAPYGYTRDPETGEVRPKKTAGRRPRGAAAPKPVGVPPSLDELKAAKDSEPKAKAREDVAPAAPAKGGSRRAPKMTAPPEPKTPFRAGPIAKGVNRIYRRAGKIIRTWDPAVGQAVIECATKEDDDDVTVGEAWEELARVNPKIRAFLERVISGGAWGSLVAAHMPIVLAILLKDSVRQRLPLSGLLGAVLDVEEDAQDRTAGQDGLAGLGAVFAGMGPEDLAAMAQTAMGFMGMTTAQMPRDPGGTGREPVPGEVIGQEPAA